MNLEGAETILSKATLRSDNHEMSKEELRRQHQAELARQKNEETARRLAGGGSSATDNRGGAKTIGDLVAYKNVNDLPPPREFMIQIDQKNEAIILPIHGSMVPFHVATVKSVSSQQDGNRTCYIRIIFNVPGTPFSPHDANSLKFQGSIYLKEVSFRSKDSRHISEVVQQIKTLRRQVTSRESERAERATLVSQEKLQLSSTKFKPIKLLDLWVRPPFGGRGRKLTGSLEAHTNGLRYSTSRPDERVDVMFSNIKHAFFQPAEKEMITLVHFHLHNHIMVGNKKTKDVQFYIEVIDVVQTIGGGKRSAYDPDEIEEEQRERDRKNKINMDFQNFVNRVNDVWGQPQFKALDLEFDQPLRELGFHGVPHKVSAFIVPTSSCLVELIETPCVVITLSEIEIVNLERVGLGQKNFDMTVVFKDFKRDVLRIDSIPSTSLDGIKEWLNTTDLKYYESRLNLNWRPILKTITDDPEKFIEDGGWEFLNMEVSDSDSDKSVDSDQGPRMMRKRTLSEDSEEEEGKTWEELEREASYADREKGNDSDSEEERKRRKIKALGKSLEPARAPTRAPARAPTRAPARAPTRPPARPPLRPPARPLARPPDRRNVSGSLTKRPKLSKEKGCIFEGLQWTDRIWKGPLVARPSYKQILFRVSMLDMKMQALKCWKNCSDRYYIPQGTAAKAIKLFFSVMTFTLIHYFSKLFKDSKFFTTELWRLKPLAPNPEETSDVQFRGFLNLKIQNRTVIREYTEESGQLVEVCSLHGHLLGILSLTFCLQPAGPRARLAN
ncbi:hypothetical protein OIU84_006913 [Salix udensis]|uniref:FACT complex subunit n=1 Tax=Salix udensis TaxID=889485 RepID=A0AAD6JZS6_9ROSI|nr:hypothetical protein OIU84_006913 [Salix udensis]